MIDDDDDECDFKFCVFSFKFSPPNKQTNKQTIKTQKQTTNKSDDAYEEEVKNSSLQQMNNCCVSERENDEMGKIETKSRSAAQK